MARYGMIIDIDRCNGCYNCFLACKDEFAGNDYPPLSLAQPLTGKPWMGMVEKERGACPRVKVDYIPQPCQQCEDATCVAAAAEGEIYKRPDGIVIIDPEKSKGRKDILSTCPYRVIQWNEEKGIPQKCTFCAHLLDQGWKEPRCVEACPSGALLFGDINDPDSDISRQIKAGDTEEFHPEYGLKPAVLYQDLPKRFIAGEIVLRDRQDQCAVGVIVTLKQGNGEKTCKTDGFGDFEFEGLDPGQALDIKIAHEGYQTLELSLDPGKDLNMGEIFLEPTG